ncbi:MAG TPA: hypothetical protein PLC35_10890, partial [Methanosarcina vacuolata]|nr:hypothetical protein [Methanosarcina vacuolata]
QSSMLLHDDLYCFTSLATLSKIPVYFQNQTIGHAEGFRIIRIGKLSGLRFLLYDYDMSIIPDELFWKNYIFISDTRATAAACRGCFITRIEIDTPPPEILSLQ